jgi:hypothetical protein
VGGDSHLNSLLCVIADNNIDVEFGFISRANDEPI